MQKILTHEMSRKEFLTYCGMIMLMVFGITSMLKKLSVLSPSKHTKQPKLAQGKTAFGQGAYGV